MTAATCHFLPLSAAQNIAACNITTKRQKRLITDFISLGMGAINLGISAANSMQISNLQKQVAVVEKALTEYSHNLQIQGAQLAKIHANQIELADELRVTQQVLNTMIPILSSHSESINTLKSGIEQLHIQLQRSFLYLAITQILRNDLTLGFLLPDDLYKVIYHVIQQGNLTFNSRHGSIPVVQIITKLLVRQQIDFIPSSQYKAQNPQEIGRLVITSFFAVPQQKHTSFLTYKLLAVPFFYKNQTLQLTQIPRYWAINPTNNMTMEWHDPHESGCDLQLMTSCRDTPPIQTMPEETCLETWSPLPTPSTALHCNSMPTQTKSNLFKQQQWQEHESSYQQHLKPLMLLECGPSFHRNYRTMPYPIPLMSLHPPCYQSPSAGSINTQTNLCNKWTSDRLHNNSKRHRQINRHKYFKSHSKSKFNPKPINNINTNSRIAGTIQNEMKEPEEYETPSVIDESSLDINDIIHTEMIELS
ncbi:unnamed protein product [Adineta steineri]|nr:unnamed protein product [Adineta steineri]CAF1588109.1 unnamed protein product [Adineta steineri]CAF3500334.1 unnamed protein product [Adineta steineri]CAF4044490.1 unnamed protein product [Adineta steineri]